MDVETDYEDDEISDDDDYENFLQDLGDNLDKLIGDLQAAKAEKHENADAEEDINEDYEAFIQSLGDKLDKAIDDLQEAQAELIDEEKEEQEIGDKDGEAIGKEEGESTNKSSLAETSESENPHETTEESNLDNEEDKASSSIENYENTGIKEQVPQEGPKSKNPEVDESGAIEKGEHSSRKPVKLEEFNVQQEGEKEETDEESKSLPK